MRASSRICARKEGRGTSQVHELGAKFMRRQELLTADELAERLQIRPRTIRLWARRGWIPAIRLSPKVVRFELDSVVHAMTTRHGNPKRTELR